MCNNNMNRLKQKAVFAGMGVLSLIIAAPLPAATTYAVVEPNPLQQVEKRLNATDINAYINTPRKDWSVFKGIPYPVVTRSQSRYFTPWYTTEFDIKDGDGKVVYPAGYTFNPLQFARYPQRLVVFKLNQLDKIKSLLRPSDTLIADAGDVIQAAEKLGRHISLVEPNMDKRLGLRAVPSIITQIGQRFHIMEIDVNELD